MEWETRGGVRNMGWAGKHEVGWKTMDVGKNRGRGEKEWDGKEKLKWKRVWGGHKGWGVQERVQVSGERVGKGRLWVNCLCLHSVSTTQ